MTDCDFSPKPLLPPPPIDPASLPPFGHGPCIPEITGGIEVVDCDGNAVTTGQPIEIVDGPGCDRVLRGQIQVCVPEIPCIPTISGGVTVASCGKETTVSEVSSIRIVPDPGSECGVKLEGEIQICTTIPEIPEIPCIPMISGSAGINVRLASVQIGNQPYVIKGAPEGMKVTGTATSTLAGTGETTEATDVEVEYHPAGRDRLGNYHDEYIEITSTYPSEFGPYTKRESLSPWEADGTNTTDSGITVDISDILDAQKARWDGVPHRDGQDRELPIASGVVFSSTKDEKRIEELSGWIPPENSIYIAPTGECSYELGGSLNVEIPCTPVLGTSVSIKSCEPERTHVKIIKPLSFVPVDTKIINGCGIELQGEIEICTDISGASCVPTVTGGISITAIGDVATVTEKVPIRIVPDPNPESECGVKLEGEIEISVDIPPDLVSKIETLELQIDDWNPRVSALEDEVFGPGGSGGDDEEDCTVEMNLKMLDVGTLRLPCSISSGDAATIIATVSTDGPSVRLTGAGSGVNPNHLYLQQQPDGTIGMNISQVNGSNVKKIDVSIGDIEALGEHVPEALAVKFNEYYVVVNGELKQAAFLCSAPYDPAVPGDIYG